LNIVWKLIPEYESEEGENIVRAAMKTLAAIESGASKNGSVSIAPESAEEAIERQSMRDFADCAPYQHYTPPKEDKEERTE
jgi:hypothetical protein